MDRLFVGTEAARDIKKAKLLFERVLDMFYPDHAPIQLIYRNESSYDKIYHAAGAQYEPSSYSTWLLINDYKNSVAFKTCIQIGYKPREIKHFLNFAAAMVKLQYKKIGSQNAGGRSEIYISDNGSGFERPGHENASISDAIIPFYLDEIRDGKKKFNSLTAKDLTENVCKYIDEEDEDKIYPIIEEWWKSLQNNVTS